MINIKGIICFDMDGTIADLYSVPGWVDKLHYEDATPYRQAKPLVDMKKLNEILNNLIEKGWEVRVISWLAMNSSEEYKKAVREAKIDWLDRFKFPYQKAHLVQYGTTKADCVRKAGDCPKILIDDNEKVRNGWHLGMTIDANKKDWLDELEKLL